MNGNAMFLAAATALVFVPGCSPAPVSSSNSALNYAATTGTGGASVVTTKLDPGNYAVAADYSARNKGLAVIVMKDGEIVFERYDNGHKPDRPVHIASATKSFWGPAIVALIDDGIVSGFDERISDTITEWRDDRDKSEMTLRHVLTLTTGLRQMNPQTDPLRKAETRDKYALALERDIGRAPGTHFIYGPNHFYVLGAWLKRKLKGRYADPLEYLQERILDPIGVRIGDWERDPSGNPNVPNGASLTARDWIRYGQFALQLGQWEGRQVVNRERMAELFEPSRINPAYGMTWWLNSPDGYGSKLQGNPKSRAGLPGGFIYPNGLPDLALAAGQGRNKLYVIPSLNMVVVRQALGESPRRGMNDHEFIGLLVAGKGGDAPVKEGGKSARGGRQGQAGGAASGGRSAGGYGGGSDRFQRMLERLDKNGDGQLSRDEVPEQMTRLNEMFERLDRNSDGVVSADEAPSGDGAAGAGRSSKTSRSESTSRGGRSSGGRRANEARGSAKNEQADGDRVIRISAPGASYIDPEFLQSEDLATFGYRDSVYVARMNPDTGDFLVPGGQEWFIDSDMAPLGKTFSGPEFGLDENGWAVYYDKDMKGTFQLWKGSVHNGKTTRSQLTFGDNHQTGRASKAPNAASTRVLFIRGTWRNGTAAWLDTADPTREHDIMRVDTGVISLSWIRGQRNVVTSIREAGGRGQLGIYDPETMRVEQITNDGGDKTDPYAWSAPEFAGELLVNAIIDDSIIAVYRATGGRYWERIATLPIPPESGNNVVGSAEPFVVGNRSYISLQIKNRKARIGSFEDGQIWIYGIDDDPGERVAFRCDGGGSLVQRFDPETYVGRDEAFVYYNVASPKRKFEVWRCRTGLRR